MISVQDMIRYWIKVLKSLLPLLFIRMQCSHPQEMHRQNHWQMYWYCCQQSGYCGTYHIFVQYTMYFFFSLWFLLL